MHNLNDIVIFVHVVEHGSFSSAAAVLRMSTSRVSRRISALEEQLGAQLLKRSTRHLSLTEAGEQFYKKCAPALAVLNSAQNDTASISDVPKGTLRVHAAVGVGQGLVAEAAVAFKQDYPDIAVDLYIDSDRENLMRDGYDIVVKTSDVTDSSLICEDLAGLRHLVVASSVYLKKTGRPQTPQDLAKHNCLLQYGRRPAGEWRFLQPDGSEYSVKVSGSFRSTNAFALCKAAAAGVGIARVPEYVLQNQDGPQLEVVFDDCVAIAREVKAFYPRSQHIPAKVRIFMKYLRKADEKRVAAQVRRRA